MSGLPNDAYWVEEGLLMAGPYPGRRDREGAIEKLSALAAAGVTWIIDLTFLKGESTDNLEPYDQLLDQLPDGNRPGYSRHPIVDVETPSARLMAEILTEIDGHLAREETVYVHCWGGVGRTGTVVGCHLVETGLNAAQALDRIATLRSGLDREWRESPETPAQRDFIRTWKAERTPGRSEWRRRAPVTNRNAEDRE